MEAGGEKEEDSWVLQHRPDTFLNLRLYDVQTQILR